MTKWSRALWRRKLRYRQRKLRYYKRRGQHVNARHWAFTVVEAKRKLGLLPPAVAPKPRENLKGIDVSSYNGNVNWIDVRAAGYTFAVCKTSEGADWADPSWVPARVDALRKANVAVGVYHFMRPKVRKGGGAAEARYFIGRARSAGWGLPGDVRPVLDLEASELTPAQTVKYLVEAVTEVKHLTGKPPIIYTGGPWWDEHTDAHADSYGCPLWLAAYVTDPQPYLPAAWKRANWTLWQHTDRGSVPGVPTPNVDVNVARYLPLL